jgi:hypothetical protein
MTDDSLSSTRDGDNDRWRHRLVAIVVAVMALGVFGSTRAAAQDNPASGSSCAGGPPGVGGFRIRRAGASAAVLEATQEQTTIAAQFIGQQNWNVGSDASPTCGWNHQRTVADISASYDGKKSASGVLTVTRNYGGRFQHMMFLKSNASFAYGTADFYSNNSLGIELTQSYAGGWGYARGAFEVEADVRFITDKYLPQGDTQHLLGLGLGGRYDFSLDQLLAAADLSVAATVVPVLNQSEAWRANSTLQLFLPFNAGVWGLTLGAQDNYLRSAPSGFRRNYFKTTIGLAYSPK